MDCKELISMASDPAVKPSMNRYADCTESLGQEHLTGDSINMLVSYWSGYARCLFERAQLTKGELKEFREWLDGKLWH